MPGTIEVIVASRMLFSKPRRYGAVLNDQRAGWTSVSWFCVFSKGELDDGDGRYPEDEERVDRRTAPSARCGTRDADGATDLREEVAASGPGDLRSPGRRRPPRCQVSGLPRRRLYAPVLTSIGQYFATTSLAVAIWAWVGNLVTPVGAGGSAASALAVRRGGATRGREARSDGPRPRATGSGRWSSRGTPPRGVPPPGRALLC